MLSTVSNFRFATEGYSSMFKNLEIIEVLYALATTPITISNNTDYNAVVVVIYSFT